MNNLIPCAVKKGITDTERTYKLNLNNNNNDSVNVAKIHYDNLACCKNATMSYQNIQ